MCSFKNFKLHQLALLALIIAATAPFSEAVARESSSRRKLDGDFDFADEVKYLTVIHYCAALYFFMIITAGAYYNPPILLPAASLDSSYLHRNKLLYELKECYSCVVIIIYMGSLIAMCDQWSSIVKKNL